jgi:FkbM family methyltransferase
MLAETLSRLPNFVSRFGALHGVRLGLGVGARRTDPAAAARAVRVPGFADPVWMRPTRSDYSIFWQCLVRGQYDFSGFPQMAELRRRAEAMLAAGKTPVIVDGGGNVGYATRTFARDFSFAHVVAVEPDADNMRVLRQNAAGLGDRFTAVHGAIASREGNSRVVSFERGSAGLQTEYCAAGAPGAVPALTIDQLVAMVPEGRPWIVKLDIEGAQDELFSAGTDWIGRTDLIILEPDDWAFPWSGSTVNFFRALSAHRFDYLLHGELILAFRHRD